MENFFDKYFGSPEKNVFHEKKDSTNPDLYSYLEGSSIVESEFNEKASSFIASYTYNPVVFENNLIRHNGSTPSEEFNFYLNLIKYKKSFDRLQAYIKFWYSIIESQNTFTSSNHIREKTLESRFFYFMIFEKSPFILSDKEEKEYLLSFIDGIETPFKDLVKDNLDLYQSVTSSDTVIKYCYLFCKELFDELIVFTDLKLVIFEHLSRDDFIHFTLEQELLKNSNFYEIVLKSDKELFYKNLLTLLEIISEFYQNVDLTVDFESDRESLKGLSYEKSRLLNTMIFFENYYLSNSSSYLLGVDIQGYLGQLKSLEITEYNFSQVKVIKNLIQGVLSKLLPIFNNLESDSDENYHYSYKAKINLFINQSKTVFQGIIGIENLLLVEIRSSQSVLLTIKIKIENPLNPHLASLVDSIENILVEVNDFICMIKAKLCAGLCLTKFLDSLSDQVEKSLKEVNLTQIDELFSVKISGFELLEKQSLTLGLQGSSCPIINQKAEEHKQGVYDAIEVKLDEVTKQNIKDAGVKTPSFTINDDGNRVEDAEERRIYDEAYDLEKIEVEKYLSPVNSKEDYISAVMDSCSKSWGDMISNSHISTEIAGFLSSAEEAINAIIENVTSEPKCNCLQVDLIPDINIPKLLDVDIDLTALKLEIPKLNPKLVRC